MKTCFRHVKSADQGILILREFILDLIDQSTQTGMYFARFIRSSIRQRSRPGRKKLTFSYLFVACFNIFLVLFSVSLFREEPVEWFISMFFPSIFFCLLQAFLVEIWSKAAVYFFIPNAVYDVFLDLRRKVQGHMRHFLDESNRERIEIPEFSAAKFLFASFKISKFTALSAEKAMVLAYGDPKPPVAERAVELGCMERLMIFLLSGYGHREQTLVCSSIFTTVCYVLLAIPTVAISDSSWYAISPWLVLVLAFFLTAIVLFSLQRKRNAQIYDWASTGSEGVEEELPDWVIEATSTPQPTPYFRLPYIFTNPPTKVTHDWTTDSNCEICTALGRVILGNGQKRIYLACGHNVCRSCILNGNHQECPYCRGERKRKIILDSARSFVLRTVASATKEVVDRKRTDIQAYLEKLDEMAFVRAIEAAKAISARERIKEGRPLIEFSDTTINSEVNGGGGIKNPKRRGGIAVTPVDVKRGIQIRKTRSELSINEDKERSELHASKSLNVMKSKGLENEIEWKKRERREKSEEDDKLEGQDEELIASEVDSSSLLDDYDENLKVYSDEDYSIGSGSPVVYSDASASYDTEESISSSQVSELSESGSTSDTVSRSPSFKSDLHHKSSSSFSIEPAVEDDDSVNSFVDGSGDSYESDMTGQLSVIPEDEIYDDSLDGRDSSGGDSDYDSLDLDALSADSSEVELDDDDDDEYDDNDDEGDEDEDFSEASISD